jgi:succinate dehydrogenase/fumarate reductase flavoprotein subunit
VAGEDAGGVHGANRLGGNGVAESTVFGALAGEHAVRLIPQLALSAVDAEELAAVRAQALAPLGRTPGEDPFALRTAIQDEMWEHAGLVRDAAGLQQAVARLREIETRCGDVAAPAGRAWNLAWQEALNVRNLALVARLTAEAALYRTESRGSHFRRDFPARDDARWLVNVHQRSSPTARLWDEPVLFSRRPAPQAVAS